MVTLTTVRYGTAHTFNHSSVNAAARSACADIENNEAAPVKIEEVGVVVWENSWLSGDSYAKLRDLAGLADDDA